MSRHPVEVRFTPEFKRQVRALSKRYRHIRSDIQPVLQQIEAGRFAGDQVAGTAHTVFKVRVRNSDIPEGQELWLSSRLPGPGTRPGASCNPLFQA